MSLSSDSNHCNNATNNMFSIQALQACFLLVAPPAGLSMSVLSGKETL